MRSGEVLALDRDDVDLEHGQLIIRRTKFNKDRAIPFHQSTLEALSRYIQVRDRRWPRVTTDAFFVSIRGGRLGSASMHDVFRGLVRGSGLEGRGARGRPSAT